MSFKVVSLNETQSRLLTCLLMNRTSAVIYKDDIMKSVWDEFNLSSSNQRLWQTVNELRKKLSFIGLPDDFIENIHGMGYAVNNSKIGSLHIT
ncbi:MAG: winged helix-turn-helix domain-containing protein [Pseudomonadota bacterium]